jgi:hypothetical protein
VGVGTKWDLTGAKGAIGDEEKAPIGPDGVRLIPREDDSGTIRMRSREALIQTLWRAANDPSAVGDLTLARCVVALLLHVLGSALQTDQRAHVSGL